jgi:hypothetical protein
MEIMLAHPVLEGAWALNNAILALSLILECFYVVPRYPARTQEIPVQAASHA